MRAASGNRFNERRKQTNDANPDAKKAKQNIQDKPNADLLRTLEQKMKYLLLD